MFDADFSNLQRQVLYTTDDIGRPKVEAARDRIRAMNPDVAVELHPVHLDSDNALVTGASYTALPFTPDDR